MTDERHASGLNRREFLGALVVGVGGVAAAKAEERLRLGDHDEEGATSEKDNRSEVLEDRMDRVIQRGQEALRLRALEELIGDPMSFDFHHFLMADDNLELKPGTRVLDIQQFLLSNLYNPKLPPRLGTSKHLGSTQAGLIDEQVPRGRLISFSDGSTRTVEEVIDLPIANTETHGDITYLTIIAADQARRGRPITMHRIEGKKPNAIAGEVFTCEELAHACDRMIGKNMESFDHPEDFSDDAMHALDARLAMAFVQGEIDRVREIVLFVLGKIERHQDVFRQNFEEFRRGYSVDEDKVRGLFAEKTNALAHYFEILSRLHPESTFSPSDHLLMREAMGWLVTAEEEIIQRKGRSSAVIAHGIHAMRKLPKGFYAE